MHCDIRKRETGPDITGGNRGGRDKKKRPAQNRTGLIKKSIEKTFRTVITTDGVCTISLLHNLLSADNIYARRQRTQT